MSRAEPKRTVSINSPFGDPRHYRVKGRPQVMEDGRISLTCKRLDGKGTCWISLSPEAIEDAYETLKGVHHSAA